jgi:hypothetical protein
MNPAKFIQILRGDLIEDWLDQLQAKLEARELKWIPKVALVLVTLAILTAICAYDASLRP